MAGNERRRKNWSETEISLLFDEMYVHYPKLFGKFSASVTKEEKNKLWDQIGNNLNRDVEDVKRKFISLKSEKLKNNSNYRRAVNRTGGGTPPPPLSPMTHLLLDIIGNDNPKIQGVGSRMDSSIMDGNDSDDDDENVPPKPKRMKPKNELESLLFRQSEERHEKELILLDLKIENAKMKKMLLQSKTARLPVCTGTTEETAEIEDNIITESDYSYRRL